jgi:hypothetical protein
VYVLAALTHLLPQPVGPCAAAQELQAHRSVQYMSMRHSHHHLSTVSPLAQLLNPLLPPSAIPPHLLHNKRRVARGLTMMAVIAPAGAEPLQLLRISRGGAPFFFPGITKDTDLHPTCSGSTGLSVSPPDAAPFSWPGVVAVRDGSCSGAPTRGHAHKIPSRTVLL